MNDALEPSVPPTPPAPPEPLSAVDIRVLGCLIEKAVTTPEYYPLTLNALTAGCNQKSNRDPVLQLDEKEIVRALDNLRDRKLAWSVSQAGSRVPKYRHSFIDVVPVTPQQLAVLCELMLRGPQTAGELRNRADRLAGFLAVTDVERVLQELTTLQAGPLVAALPRLPGQREGRFVHLLGGPPPPPSEPAAVAPEPARVSLMADNARIAALETRVTALQDELERLRAQFSDFTRQFL